MLKTVEQEVKKSTNMLLIDVKTHNVKGKSKAKVSPSLKPKSRLLPLYNLQVALERVRLLASIATRPYIGRNIARPTLKARRRNWLLQLQGYSLLR